MVVKDEFGRSTGEALVYVTGSIAFAPVDQKNVLTREQLGAPKLTVGSEFRYLGLRTKDGGPEEAAEAGETIEFLERGFEIAGEGKFTEKMTLAQYNATVRELVRGAKPDANGVIDVVTASPDATWIMVMTSIYKDGWVQRKAGVFRVLEGKVQKDERGAVKGVEVTFKWLPHVLFDNAYFREVVFQTVAPSPVPPKPVA